MTQEQAKVNAPDLVGGYWVNSEPVSMPEQKGKVVLLDFWDYTCVNCIRTLPYVAEWHRRYADKGLVVVGVHAPEFSFAKELDGVKSAVEEFEIEYPVVMDNGMSIWQAYANRYWPAKYLVDKEGYVRYYHFGEGNYQQTEEVVQTLLREIDPKVELPEAMSPVRDSDQPGAVCHRVTPELYLGYQRGQVGNPGGHVPNASHTYKDPGIHAEGFAYLSGEWRADEEHTMKPFGSETESSVAIRYMSKEVNLVMNPLLGSTCRAYLTQNGAPVAKDDATDDVKFEDDGRSYVEVDKPRMYKLIDNREIGTHDLTLSTTSPGLRLYAFTFVSCVAPD